MIALSSHAQRQYVLAAFEAGASGYVVKASASEELLRAVRAVRAVREGRRFVSDAVADVVIEGCVGDSGILRTSDELGSREREVLQLLAEGFTSGEIAARMDIATSTVETHRRNIMRKLDLHSIAELTKYAIREGLTSP